MAGQLAIVTGASTGIGFELARLCAREGYDLLIAADEPEIHDAAQKLRDEKGVGAVEALHVDLATTEGVDQLYAAAKGRPVDVLMANAGRGLGQAFLDQEWPGATETEFFVRADMLDTKVGSEAKDDAAVVAKTGFEAMMKGEGDVVSGLKNKIQSAVANVMPAERLARQHRQMAEPGTAKS